MTVTSLTLDRGDSIVFYTDGATDVVPPYGLTPAQLEEFLQPERLTKPHFSTLLKPK